MSSPREAQLPLLLSISEGLSRGTDEMLRVSPQGDAIHPPSCSLAIREAVEEIKWLRAEVERLRDQIYESIPKWQANELQREIDRLQPENERLREAIRTSRARCVELELKNESLRVAATSAGAALAAAIELLERGREDAPSKRMFSQMLADYRVIVARTRRALEG